MPNGTALADPPYGAGLQMAIFPKQWFCHLHAHAGVYPTSKSGNPIRKAHRATGEQLHHVRVLASPDVSDSETGADVAGRPGEQPRDLLARHSGYRCAHLPFRSSSPESDTRPGEPWLCGQSGALWNVKPLHHYPGTTFRPCTRFRPGTKCPYPCTRFRRGRNLMPVTPEPRSPKP